MPAPEALACRHQRVRRDLAYHGALSRLRTFVAALFARPCHKRPTHRVRFHVVLAGSGAWLVAEVCDAHRRELEQLGLCCWAFPISP